MRLFLILFLSTFCMIADATWNQDAVTSSTKILTSPEFQSLENKVLEAVKGTWCSEEKAQLILELIVLSQPENCVEIGTFTGSSAIPLLAGISFINHGHAYMIDAWSNKEAVKNLDENDPHTQWWATVDMQIAKTQFLSMLTQWSFEKYCTIYATTSAKAVPKIPEIDFLHLDGNFSEKGAKEDTTLYLPKVKQGGYILISNLYFTINGVKQKKEALWPIFDTCEIIAEIEHGNSILFRKS
jgi:hypothetical protein